MILVIKMANSTSNITNNTVSNKHSKQSAITGNILQEIAINRFYAYIID